MFNHKSYICGYEWGCFDACLIFLKFWKTGSKKNGERFPLSEGLQWVQCSMCSWSHRILYFKIVNFLLYCFATIALIIATIAVVHFYCAWLLLYTLKKYSLLLPSRKKKGYHGLAQICLLLCLEIINESCLLKKRKQKMRAWTPDRARAVAPALRAQEKCITYKVKYPKYVTNQGNIGRMLMKLDPIFSYDEIHSKTLFI